jgi:formamidopyrimidine-DNA glycosylase
LLNQSIGVGIGNILQIEALYYAKIHPLSKTKNLKLDDFKNIIKGIKNVVNKILNNENYLIYHKKYCPKDHKSTTKYLGIYNRRMNFCNQCQLIK